MAPMVRLVIPLPQGPLLFVHRPEISMTALRSMRIKAMFRMKDKAFAKARAGGKDGGNLAIGGAT